MVDHRGYLDGLPIGERPVIDPSGLVGWGIFPFEVDSLVPKVLDAPVMPEPPRNGEEGSAGCYACAADEDLVLWEDEGWRVMRPEVPSAVPCIVQLVPRAHHDLADLPAHLSHQLGPMIQRVEAAVRQVPGTGRVHVNKWGDGAAHLHLFFFARPIGMMQLRGSSLVDWDDILPALDDDVWRRNLRIVADSLSQR
jgi:diadenosine tetraphosphate (Ap4A) HIT family hydrolase